MSFDPLSLNNVNTTTSVSATSGYVNVGITAVTPATIPHFDCSSEIECEITNILIFHDIFISVNKPEPKTATAKSAVQFYTFINVGPPETTWTINIGGNEYRIKLSGKTLHFYKPDGISYKITHDDISELLLTLIHSEMSFCNKCTIPTQKFIVFQENESTGGAYSLDWGHNKQTTIKTVPNTSDVVIMTTSGVQPFTQLTTTKPVKIEEDPYIWHNFKSTK